MEVSCDGAEHGLVSRLLLLAQLGDELLEVGARGGDVVKLRAQRLEALLELVALRLGEGVGGSDLLESLLERPHLLLARLAAGDLLRRATVGPAQPDLFPPRA